MSKTIVYISMTLDGYVAGKDDDLSWLMPYSTVDYGYNEFYSTIGAIILGKRTYDHIIGNWDWPYGNVPAFVLSDSPLKDIPKGAEIYVASGDITDVLHQAKSKTDKCIWIGGGAHVVQEFLNKGFVDELIITVVPVLLGGGIRLLENISVGIELKLHDTKTYDEGLVQLSYIVISD